MKSKWNIVYYETAKKECPVEDFNNMRTFKKHLAEQKKNPEFVKAYNEEKKIIELAVKIATERNKQGMSQSELAKKAHVIQQQLSKVENGSNYTIKTFLKIAGALRIDLL